MRGQSSVEFLYCTGLAIAIFILVALIYVQGQEEASALGEYVEASRICHETAMQFSAVVAAGNGTQTVLLRPGAALARNYTVFVSSPARSVVVGLGSQNASCPLATGGASNGSSGEFYISDDVPIRNENGGVVVG